MFVEENNECKSEYKRCKGRPRWGWMVGVNRALGDKGMDVQEGRKSARDKNDWETIVRPA